MPHIIYHPDKPVGPFNVEEYCPFCDTFIPILFDLDEPDNVKTVCPECGRVLMICTMCPRYHECNWNKEHGCFFNPHIYIPCETMDKIASFMNQKLYAKVYEELAPCTHEEFLRRYLELEPGFSVVLEQRFGLHM